jgi:V/A-type H+/Na+-transporting ATPase subunit I
MAIKPMNKVTLAVPNRRVDEATTMLKKLGLLHPRRVSGSDKNKQEDADLLLERSKKTLQSIDKLFPPKLPFVANFAWPRPRLSEQKYNKLLSEIELSTFSDKLLELMHDLDRIQDQASKLSNERHLLSRYAFLPVPTSIDDTEHVSYILGQAPRRNLTRLIKLNKRSDCAVDKYGQDVILVTCLKSCNPEIKTELSKIGFESLPIPKSSLTPAIQIKKIDRQLDKLTKKRKATLQTIKNEYHSKRLVLLVNIDSLEMKSEVDRVRNLAYNSEHSILFIGYIPTTQSQDFRSVFQDRFPEGYLDIQEVPTTEEPPVELINNRYSSPFEMLTGMYGLPSYRGLDSTFIVSIIFPIFFGICFGDVLYGLMLMGFSLWFGRIYKHEKSARKFFCTFLISSIFVIVIGALTGAWGGNLVGSVITWQPILNLRGALWKIDPIKETIPFFIVTLYIGIGTQFLGIISKGWMQARDGKWIDAITDSGGWLIFLSGLTLFAVNFLSTNGLSSSLTTLMYLLIGVGAVLLIFSQGRDAKSVVGRIGVGITSLYGVLGGYGTTGFLSDVMSYSRLLALGLTTSIVGQAFNSIAQMMGLKGIGLIFAILILIVGHLFNFFLNIIGSFVHPARLVFLEYYTRFYESGGGKYRPFSGKNHTRINVVYNTNEGNNNLQEVA